MRKIIESIKNDRILDILLLGVFGPLGFLIVVVISAIIGITLPVNLGSSFANILLTVFNVSVPLLIGYLALVKLKIFNKSSLTKFFSVLWILLSVIASLIWIYASSIQLKYYSDIQSLGFLLLAFSFILFGIGLLLLIIYYFVSKWNPQNIRAYYFSMISIIVTALITSSIVYLIKPSKIILPKPFPVDISQKTDLACTGLMNSSMMLNEIPGQPVGLTGEVTTQSLDKMAVKINPDNISLLTQAAVGVGESNSSAMKIVENNSQKIIAMDTDSGPSKLITERDVVIIDKKNGYLVWNRTFGDMFLSSSTPSTETEYFSCY